MDKDFSKLIRANQMKNVQFKTFLGIALSGSKNDKTVLCELQYFPKLDKLVLANLEDKIGPNTTKSSDSILISKIKNIKKIESIGVNAALGLPKCSKCKLRCPGQESCKLSEVKWLRESYQKVLRKNKKAKLFSPYTDRAVEYYVNHFLDEPVELPFALSANSAPITARAQFLQRHLPAKKMKEVLPALSVWRIGHYLRVQKSYLKYYRNSSDCEVVRLYFLDKLKDNNKVFMYNQDKQKLVSNPASFDAFISALSVYIDFQGYSSPKPKGFPRGADWLSFPLKDIGDLF
ncbi:MAG: DUF429 domain-containing protein [Bdellovibrionales bacterium]